MTVPNMAETLSLQPATRRAPLDAFFRPRNVAIIGATENLAGVGRSIVSNLKETSFGGVVYPVNPTRPTVLGLPCYPNIGAIPEKVDLAVIATPLRSRIAFYMTKHLLCANHPFTSKKKDESDLLSLDVRYWQNLQGGQDVTTAQKLPALSYTIVPKWIDGTPFYYTLDSSAVNYWSPQDTTEQRLDVYPRVYYPLHWGNYLDIESSAGFRNDSYAIQWQNETLNNFTGRAQPGAKPVGSLINPYAVQFQNLTLNENEFTERTVPDAKVEMSSRVNKEYQVDFMDLTAVQHAIQPEISYEYATQSTFGNQTPLIDRLDQDQARDGIRYGFTTFLTGKEVAKDANGNPILDADGNPTTFYRELVRFRVFQFFNVEPPSVPEPIFLTQNVMRQGLSPVGFRLDITPQKYFSISYDVDVDWNSTGQGGAQSLYMSLDSGKGQVVTISYQDIPGLAVNEVSLITNLKVYKDIYVSTWHDYSLDAGIMFTAGIRGQVYTGVLGSGRRIRKAGP